LNILYYGEADIERGGGVGKVAYYLSNALRKKIGVTCFGGVKSDDNFAKIYFDVFNKFIKKEFDIMHFNSYPTYSNGAALLLRFAKLRKTCTVLNIHGIPELEGRAEQWLETAPFLNLMTRLSYYKMADRIIVNSQFMRDFAILFYGLDPDKVKVIPNGVDLEVFTNSNKRISLEGHPAVLFIGHFARLKGIDILIRAIAKLKPELPNIKLHLVGRGNDKYFASLAKKEGVEEQVIFHSWVTQSKAASYYKSADICVFPSRHEGFGIVILEAMASGTPVIASDIPSFREILSDGVDGRLFEKEDAEALAEAIIALYNNPKLRTQLSHHATQKVTQYSWDKIADKYISLYNSLIE
jgi:glycosyltransferase involved in cell wall biosynthesis